MFYGFMQPQFYLNNQVAKIEGISPRQVLSLTDKGVVIEKVGSVDCLVPVRLGAGEQQFELTANETVTVTDVSQPIEVSAVSVQDE